MCVQFAGLASDCVGFILGSQIQDKEQLPCFVEAQEEVITAFTFFIQMNLRSPRIRCKLF